MELKAFYTCDLRTIRKFDLGVLIVIAKTMGNLKSFFKSLDHRFIGYTCKVDLDRDPHF